MRFAVRGLSGKNGGRIEGFYRGKDGPVLLFLSPPAQRSAGMRFTLRMHPSRMWHGCGNCGR